MTAPLPEDALTESDGSSGANAPDPAPGDGSDPTGAHDHFDDGKFDGEFDDHRPDDHDDTSDWSDGDRAEDDWAEDDWVHDGGLTHRDNRWIDLAVVALLLIPFLITAAHAFTTDWEPLSDFAIIEARTADVGTSNSPLTGAYSRTGFDHPGPAFFLAAAPLYRLLGSDPNALLLTATFVNAAALGWSAWMLRRRLPSAAAGAATLVLAVLVLGQAHNDLLLDPWNPSVLVFPFLAFIVASWRTAAGEAFGPVVAIVAGSWVLQAHFGSVLVVAVTAVAALALGGRALWQERHRDLGWFAAAFVAVVAMWIAPLLDQFTGSGNFGAILSWSTGGSSDLETVGLGKAASILAYQMRPEGPWSGTVADFGFLEEAPAMWLVLCASVAVGAVLVGRARRVAGLTEMGTILGVALLGALLSIAQIRGPSAVYLANWSRPLAALLWITAAWQVLELLRVATVRAVDLTMCGVAAVVTFMAIPVANDQYLPDQQLGDAVAQAATALTTQNLRPEDPLQVSTPGESFFMIGSGLLMHLERNGWDVVEPVGGDRPLMGEHRQGDAAGRRVLAITYGQQDFDNLNADPAYELLQRVDAVNRRFDPDAFVAGDNTPTIPVAIFEQVG